MYYLHPSLKNSLSLLCFGGLVLLPAIPGFAQDLSLNDFNTNAIINGTGTTVSGNYFFSNGAGLATTSYASVSLAYGSIASLGDGGNIAQFDNYKYSTVYVTGGSVGTLLTQGYGCYSYISGGTITNANVFGGTGNISGATITNLDVDGDDYFGDSIVTVMSGNVGSITAEGNLDAGGHVNLLGGSIGKLSTYSLGTINVYGTNLLLSGGFVTGVLQNGSSIDAAYTNKGGTLNLINAPVPEASTTVSFGLLLSLGIGGIIVANRRKKATASA